MSEYAIAGAIFVALAMLGNFSERPLVSTSCVGTGGALVTVCR